MCDLKCVISCGYAFASLLSPQTGVHLEHPPHVKKESPLHALKRAQHHHSSYYVTTRAFQFLDGKLEHGTHLMQLRGKIFNISYEFIRAALQIIAFSPLKIYLGLKMKSIDLKLGW